jgi:hypothetical protein
VSRAEDSWSPRQREYSSLIQTVPICARQDQVKKLSITDAKELIRRALKSKTYGASTP